MLQPLGSGRQACRSGPKGPAAPVALPLSVAIAGGLPSSDHADNISRKLGLSIVVLGQGPGIQGELPHHADPLGGRRRLQVGLVSLVGEVRGPDGTVAVHYDVTVAENGRPGPRARDQQG